MKSIIYLFFIAALFTPGFANAQRVNDKDIKKNVEPINSPLTMINSLEPKSFEFNTADYKYLKLPDGSWYGFMTEDFQQVFPSLVEHKTHRVTTGKNAFRTAVTSSVNLEGLIPVLVASIQAQQEQIEILKKSVDDLKAKLDKR